MLYLNPRMHRRGRGDRPVLPAGEPLYVHGCEMPPLALDGTRRCAAATEADCEDLIASVDTPCWNGERTTWNLTG